MDLPILVTKINLPPLRPQLVQRPDLMSRLDESLRRGHKLLLISAPPGFGKTTLLSAWAHALADRPALAGPDRAEEVQVAWLSLDATDNDLSHFLAYLVAALQTVDSATDAQSVGPGSSSQPAPVSLVLSSLLNQMAGLPDFVLVLDDYHLIEAAPVHEAVAYLLGRLPSQAHLVIASRTDPPISLSRLRGRGELTELRASDLRFGPDEAAAFLKQVMKLELSVEQVVALETRTEGWVAGLQLAALSMRGRDDKSTAAFLDSFDGSQHYILDYLTDEVLAQQTQTVRDFLLRTSILRRLTGELCDALTGREDGQDMLVRLAAANLFIVPLDDARRWYRYHHLFADALRTKLDAASHPALHLKAARWLAAHGMLPAAVEHALSSEDLSQAAGLIARASAGALRSASFTTLLSWLNALPDQLLRADSELAIYKGVVLFIRRQYVEASRWAEAAEASLAPGAPAPIRGRLQTLKAQIALYNKKAESAIQLAQESLALLSDSDVVFRSLALSVVGQVLQGQGNIAAAVDVYRQAVEVERQRGSQPGVMQLVNLLFALNETGKRGEALALCQRAVEEGTAQSGRMAPSAEVVHVVWGWLSYDANELDLARQRVLRALDFAQRVDFSDVLFLCYYLLAQVHLAGAELHAMREDARRVRQYAVRLNLEFPYEPRLAALEAQASLLQGDLAGAQRWAEASGLSPNDVPEYWAEPLYSTYVRLLLAQERGLDAETLLINMERSAQEGGRRRRLITVHLQQALVQQALGHRQQALARVADALRLAVPEGYRRVFLDEGPALLELLPAVRHLAPLFVDELLGAAGLERVVQRPQPLVEPLSERELEVLQLIAAGLSNREIGQRLFITPGTVKVHAANIYGKLGVHSRTQAVAKASALGIL